MVVTFLAAKLLLNITCVYQISLALSNSSLVYITSILIASWTWPCTAVFIWALKTILVLHLLRYAIGFKNSWQFFIQSEAKPKPIVARSRTFSRASRQLHEITSRFDCQVLCIVYVLCDWLVWFFLVLALRHSIENRWKTDESMVVPSTMRFWKPLFSFFRGDPEVTFALCWGRCALLPLSFKTTEAGYLVSLLNPWTFLLRSRASSGLAPGFADPVIW